MTDAGEECDDGNLIDGDGCDSNCRPTGCGNGVVTGSEACDDGNLISGDGCQANCTLSPVHDTVLVPPRPVKVRLRAGASQATTRVVTAVRNADLAGGFAGDGHEIQLTVSSGDCPVGTVVGPVEFRGGASSIVVPPGRTARARVALTLPASIFTSANALAPRRCTLTAAASTVTPANSFDPTWANDTAPLELNVTDENDSAIATAHESVVVSVKPVKLSIGRRQAEAKGGVRVAFRNADYLPAPEMPGHAITVSVNDGTCPLGTVSAPDFDPQAAGVQSSVVVGGAASIHALVPIRVNGSAVQGGSPGSPIRCLATARVSGPGGDVDASNDTTQLVLDVIDRADF